MFVKFEEVRTSYISKAEGVDYAVSFIRLSFEGDFKRSTDDDLKNFIIEFLVEALRLLEIIFSK